MSSGLSYDFVVRLGQIAEETREWREGEFLVFDETNRHEAWNNSNEPRVVLFLQVMRPMRWPGWLAGKAFLAAIRHQLCAGCAQGHRSGTRALKTAESLPVTQLPASVIHFVA